jgi:ribosome-binding factor A
MLRHDKVAEAIKQVVSVILHDNLKDPRMGFVTITGVELSQDYRHAKVLYSVLGKEDDYKKTADALESAIGFIRKLVSERINLKFAPEIIFRQDRSHEYSIRIQQVLDEIKAMDKPSNPSEEGVKSSEDKPVVKPRNKRLSASTKRKEKGVEPRKRNRKDQRKE